MTWPWLKRKMQLIGTAFTLQVMTPVHTEIDDSLAADLGRRLRTVRMLRGMQQAELADRAKVSRNTVIALERTGHGTVSSMVRVARALGLDEELRALFEADASTAPQGVQNRQRIRRPTRSESATVADAQLAAA